MGLAIGEMGPLGNSLHAHLHDCDLTGAPHTSPTAFMISFQPPPAAAMMDFLQWRSKQSHQIPLEAPKALPDEAYGVRPQEKVWGKWGSKATIGGRNDMLSGDVSRMPACDDAEQQPPPPCETTGECGDLLKDARRMEAAAKRSEQLMQNAVAAMQASKVMLQHAERMAKDILQDPKLSVLADEDYAHHDDLATRILWGPWEHQEPPYEPYHKPNEDWYPMTDLKHDGTSGVLTRYTEREALDKRTVDYLNLVETQTAGPSAFSAAFVTTLAAAAAPCEHPGICRRRRRECKATELDTQQRRARLPTARRAQLEAFLQVG